MAMSNMKVFTDSIVKDAPLQLERAMTMTSIAFDDNPLHRDKLFSDWVNELKERIIELEVVNQKLHKIIGTSSFNQTQA